ncbi:MAG: pseudouridine synthase [Bacteroidales bacterium]
MTFEILYQDDYFIAINKPGGLLVHRTRIAEEESVFILQLLRDQVQRHLYPVHRLDRPTSGVLLFAFDAATARTLSEALVSGEVKKEYRALVRGWLSAPVDLNYPVKNDRGNLQEAHTEFVPREYFVMYRPIGNYPSARYSVVSCFPHSGRWHQIRQHLAHLRHYIVNDRVHGDGKHNRVFKEELGIEPLFLHARYLILPHPVSGERICLKAQFPEHWQAFRELAIVETTGGETK